MRLDHQNWGGPKPFRLQRKNRSLCALDVHFNEEEIVLALGDDVIHRYNRGYQEGFAVLC
jgi:hypothetical protein